MDKGQNNLNKYPSYGSTFSTEIDKKIPIYLYIYPCANNVIFLLIFVVQTLNLMTTYNCNWSYIILPKKQIVTPPVS